MTNSVDSDEVACYDKNKMVEISLFLFHQILLQFSSFKMYHSGSVKLTTGEEIRSNRNIKDCQWTHTHTHTHTHKKANRRLGVIMYLHM